LRRLVKEEEEVDSKGAEKWREGVCFLVSSDPLRKDDKLSQTVTNVAL
jgi:hypothetical protein